VFQPIYKVIVYALDGVRQGENLGAGIYTSRTEGGMGETKSKNLHIGGMLKVEKRLG
jgi:hypothetical protein